MPGRRYVFGLLLLASTGCGRAHHHVDLAPADGGTPDAGSTQTPAIAGGSTGTAGANAQPQRDGGVAGTGAGGVSGSAGRGGSAGADAGAAGAAAVDSGVDAGPPSPCLIDHGGCDPLTLCFDDPFECGDCPTGYTGTGLTGCVDIDECATDNGGCGNPAYVECVNDVGTFICRDVDVCLTDNGGCGDPNELLCREQFEAAPLCEANECFLDNGGCGSTDEKRCRDSLDQPRVCWAGVKSIAYTVTGIFILRADHTIDCWSAQGGGRCTAFPQANYTQLSTAGLIPCALTQQGGIECLSGRPEITNGLPTTGDLAQIAVGVFHACALRLDGTATCWGSDADGQVSGPNAETGGLRQIATNGGATCIVRQNGTLHCWGDAVAGAVTDANADGGTDFTAIYMGPTNICALRTGGVPVCWGGDDMGQASGLRQAGLTGVTDISIGNNVICVVRSDTSAACWGADEYGQASSAARAGTGIVRVFAGDDRGGGRGTVFRPTCLAWGDGTWRCYGAATSIADRDAWLHPAP